MSDSIEQRTRRVVAEVFGLPLEQVTRATSPESVADWDSVNVLNILMAIEGEFGVSISPEEAADFVSVEKIITVVASKGAL